jgi:tRNA (guanine-N7-)-methyltransferase
MRGKRISISRDLRCPNQYVHMMDAEFAPWALNEERAPLFKGQWRAQGFGVDDTIPLDLEIGTGNGIHFAHYAVTQPERRLLGIELKYKPLVQSIRRALRGGAANAKILRYNACLLKDLFAMAELNDVFIHFPDPWPRKNQWKHRLVTTEFLCELSELQRPGSRIYFKTDSRCYYDWAVERLEGAPYNIICLTDDLHHSEWKDSNFVTHFEGLFLRQGLPIHQVILEKPVVNDSRPRHSLAKQSDHNLAPSEMI